MCTIRTAEKGFLNLSIPCKESCTGLFRTGEKKMSEMSRTGRESFTDLSRTGGKIGLRSQDVLIYSGQVEKDVVSTNKRSQAKVSTIYLSYW